MVSRQETSERLSIRKAAKAVGRGHTFVKQLVDENKLTAWNYGGSPKHPRLVVDMDELRRAIDRECLHVPHGLTRQQVIQKRPASKVLGQIDPAMRDL